MIAETVVYPGADGELIHAYLARPAGPGPFPAVVLAHHMPGWDAWYKEATRKMAYHGYVALAPDLYCRAGHGEPDDIAALVRSQGGVPDPQVVGDLAGGAAFLRALPYTSGKVGVMGTCSGGRHAYLAACLSDAFDACADLWGGHVVMGEADLTPNRPVAPIDYTERLSCPLLGLFGELDKAPTPEQVAQHEAALTAAGKPYEFHMYPDAGHGFFYHDRPAAYRAEQAVDGWKKLFAFFGQHLG
ncbi:MAG: dienelactone hydrolase family protein [Dehalococcoidia bacterium]|nr:dienelactone hydrolase family protein [Dehalococcoidia bacterium]